MLACVQPPTPLRKKNGEGAPSSIFPERRGQLYTGYWMAKNEKSKDYCKADSEQRVLFFITIFRLAIPAFFRFTDVTELM